MRFQTINRVSLRDLVAMSEGEMADTITDMDFLETLATHRCIVLPPWIMRANPAGGMTRITPLTYDVDGQLDKSAVLVATARQLKKLAEFRFGGRLRF